MASFGIAVYLDGAKAYRALAGEDSVEHPVDYTVTMKMYQSTDESEFPIDSVQVCPSNSGDDVHDLFMDFVVEAQDAGFPQYSVFEE